MENFNNPSPEMREFLKGMTKMVADGCFSICTKHGIEIGMEDTEILNKLFQSNTLERMLQILDDAKKSAIESDIFQNLQRRKIDSLVKSAFSVTVLHECVLWSKDIVVGMLSVKLKSLDPKSDEANKIADKIIALTTDK